MLSVRDVAIKCFQDEAQAILNLIPQLDSHFDKAVDLMLACKGKVIVTGVGKSGHIGAKMAATLSSTGTPAFFINPLDVFHGDLGVMTAQDVVIAISNSGQTDELLRFIPFLKEQQIPLIAMSGNPSSLLAQHATCHLTVRVDREACPLNLAPTSSTTATLAMGDALACALMEKRNFQAKDFAQFHPGGTLGKRLLTTACDIMRQDNLPVITPEMTLGEAILHVSKGKLGLCVAVREDKVVGLITDGDVRRAMERMHDRFFNVTVEEVMTREPHMIAPSMKVEAIRNYMCEHQVHTLLVVDEDRHLLGIVDHFGCMI